MKLKRLFLIVTLITWLPCLSAQQNTVPEVYLLTCDPGTATYSIYGHSALRVINPEKSTDIVYNWGVFDFSTPAFAWKFAKGRLDYMLVAFPFERFIQDYFLEQRAVYQQRINLDQSETDQLMLLIHDNLKPENVKYRYDFFYDDCSTRIRDLIEKAIGDKLLYPPDETRYTLTFRDKVGEYQRPYPWLNLGIDLIMGTPGDKKASFRDVMFLPLDLQRGLSEAVVNRSGKMIPLLRNSDTVLEFPRPEIENNFILSPLFLLSIILITVILVSALLKSSRILYTFDIIIFSIFSLLSLLILFFSLFTDHQQMKWNLNILWLSPFVIICLTGLILKSRRVIWYRLVFILSLIFLAIMLVFSGGFNNAFLPPLLILMLRSSARADFSWNPMSIASN